MSNFASRQAMLRALTRREHESIEKAPVLAQLMSGSLAISDYAALLVALHAFHASLEPQIASALPPSSEAHTLLDGRRVCALLDDLRWMGVQPAPMTVAVPDISCHAAALGALYVIEGSGLGGRVIARHLMDSIGVSNRRGASFYDGLTADAARVRWRLLCSALETPVPDISETIMLATASATFASLEQHLLQIPSEWLQPCLTAAAAD